MNDQRQRADPGEVTRPGERQQADGDQVVQQHLPEVLTTDRQTHKHTQSDQLVIHVSQTNTNELTQELTQRSSKS